MNADDLHQAIFTRLDDQVGGSFSGVYAAGGVPQAALSEDDSAFPFLTIGPYNFSPFDTKTSNGFEVVVTTHIWSRSTSSLVWQALRGAVYDALQKYDLTVTGCNVIDCRFDGSADYDDPDGKTRHIVLDWRITYFLT